MNTEDKIEALQKEINKLKDELRKPELEVGDWVTEADGTILRLTDTHYKRGYPKDICVVGHGLWRGQQWRGEDLPIFITKSEVRKASPIEVEEALIEEARRRYKAPCDIRYLDGKESRLRAYGLTYSPEEDRLTASSRPGKDTPYDVVYEKGEWAEVIKEEPLKVFDWKVDEKKFGVNIGCHLFDKDFLRDVIEVLEYVGDKTVEEVLKELRKLEL